MKSERFTVERTPSGPLSTYRQIEVAHFLEFDTAWRACQVANADRRRRFYVLNESGQEYYEGSWID
jgi:hypothetical protein